MMLFRSRRAFALVLVLIALVISSSMAVFFLTSVARERLGVNLYATGTEVHHLAGMPVSRVIGLINAATKEGTATNPVSWASQPGMIRTYDNTGGAKSVYKLYSWENQVEAGSSFDPSASNQFPPAGWRTENAHYVDINQPVNGIYPIIDPRAEGEVVGFSVNEGNPVVGGADKENAPMPVKWLYVLEDGQMVAPNGGAGSLANIPGASSSNPIIGRVAFWTDDETCKVNINTASEGSFWDVPRSGSRDDLQFAGNPPTKNEYQRTPGHPSMTSLSAIFPEMVDEASDPVQTRWQSGYGGQVKKIYDMVPRLAWGTTSGAFQGSQGGTYPVPRYDYNYPPVRDAIAVSTLPRPVVLDTDRLYVISDDFWFRPDRTANAALNDNLDTTEFQKRLFFLTANSRAPETTLFETPRVSLWPITWPNASSYYSVRKTRNASANLQPPTSFNDPITDSASKWITAEERLLAFCGALNTANGTGGDRYYFQRKDPDSPVLDWSNTAFPAYSKRNRDLVAYLTGLMAKPAPGFGDSLQARLGGEEEANWAGLNTFNYVRSLVNQYTVPNAVEGVRYSYTGVSFRNGKIGGVSMGAAGISEPNAKVATPIRATLKGKEYLSVGNFPALEEAAVVFYAAKRVEPVPPPMTGTDPELPTYPEWRNPFNWQNLINFDTTNGVQVGTQTTVMRAVMLLDFTGLEPGVDINSIFWVKVKGSGFKVNGSTINLPTTLGQVVKCSLDSTTTYNTVIGPLLDSNSAAKIFSNKVAPAANVWQLVSDDISVNPTNDLTFSFAGTNVTFEIYACDPANVDADPTSDSTRLIYTKKIDFGLCPNILQIPTAPRWSMSSRAYRFDNNGVVVNNSQAGLLPGGTLSKTVAPTAKANMLKFSRDSGTDRWQPYPNYYYEDASKKPGANTVVGATGPDTRWAWSEYSPTVSGVSIAIPDIRSLNSVYQTRVNTNNYVFRASIAGYTPQVASSKEDIDDKREDTEKSTNPDIVRNISTNFRKRVEATDQRNTAKRPGFCLDGWAAVAPFDYTDPNVIYKSGSSNITADLFMFSTETPLRENGPLITPCDTVVSMANKSPNGVDDRDPRLALISGSDSFPNGDNFESVKTLMGGGLSARVVDNSIYPRNTAGTQYHQLGTPGAVPSATGYRNLPTFHNTPFARSASLTSSGAAAIGDLIGAELGYQNKVPDVGDWTGMPGRYSDGGVLARPDQEYAQLAQDTSGDMYVPYFPRDTYGTYSGGPTSSLTDELSYFSPNRQVPSPVLLGTLPRTKTSHWQTFSFCPNPANIAHPGVNKVRPAAPDHLFLDLFWMPVAEPYPISDQLSTMGKINLNYRLMPFSYIERKTGLFALMKNTWMTALTDNTNNVAYFKSHGHMRSYTTGQKTRYTIDVAETLKGFDQLFNAGDLFRSASQLCEMFLVPKGESLTNMLAFWSANRLTPDNAREQPYNDLYSRVTTKSNTFTVHWRVQSLRKNPGTDVAVWDESRDRHISELRGSTLIERYIDPNTKDDPATPSVNEGIPDYATAADPEPLSRFYKWRVVSENYFQP